MSIQGTLIRNLNNLNRITDTLNQAKDISSALDLTLTRLVDLMGLDSGWVFLQDHSSQNRWAGRGFVLAAHYNLPPALSPGKPTAWKGGCDCQALCAKGQLSRAYNEVRCSRLANARGEKRGLAIHASTPICSGEQVLGILNVAGAEWGHFSEEALALLTNVGSQMGIAVERARLMDMLQQQRIDEQAALLDLSSKLLDRGSDLDELMTHVTDDVRTLLQADACALLLPDEGGETLSFRAASGWDSDPVAGGHTVPADEQSGAGLAMSIQQPLLVEDISDNDRLYHQMANDQDAHHTNEVPPASFTSDWLEHEGFRGHAVVPLIVDEDSIGALVINMRQPRLLESDELRFLRLMANQTAMAIAKASLVREQIKRERLEEELEIGQQIQRSLLPEDNPEIDGWEFASYYDSAQQIGGDFYDFFSLNNKGNLLGMVIADVSGKGVSAALFMALSRSIIRTKAFTGRRPWDVLRRSNRLICKDSRSNLFLTAFYATLDTDTGHLIYTNAGHNRPLWLNSRTGDVQELATTGIVLGVFEQVKLGEGEIEIEENDFLVVYTDGVTEAMNANRELFGEERLCDIIRARRYETAQELLDAIINGVEMFAGDTPQSDDVTLFVVKRQPT